MLEKYDIKDLYLAIILVLVSKKDYGDEFIEDKKELILKNAIEEYEYTTVLFKKDDKYVDLNNKNKKNKKSINGGNVCNVIHYKQRFWEYIDEDKKYISRRKALKLAKKHYDDLKFDYMADAQKY